MLRKPFVLMLIGATAGLVSCQKEGEGGTATITGKVYAYDYDTDMVLQSEYYAPDEDVFIVYGGGSSLYDDDYTTAYDGSFRFQNLTKGDYTIYVYSRCDSCASGTEAIIRDVVISSNGDDVILDDIVIKK